MKSVLSIVIRDANTIGPRQNVYLNDEMYRTEKKMRDARHNESASSTCDEESTFRTFCLRLWSSFLRRMSHILPKAISSSIGANPTTNMWMSLFVLMQNRTIASATVSATRFALTFLSQRPTYHKKFIVCFLIFSVLGSTRAELGSWMAGILGVSSL